MHIPILIIGGSSTTRREEANRYAGKHTQSPFDRHHIERDDTKQSIGIALVTSFMKMLLLTPIQGSTKAGSIYEIQDATEEAQSALLKLLEEPDDTTLLILTAAGTDRILPTILSRCRIISLEKENSTSIPTNISNLLRTSYGQRLSLAEQIVSENRTVESVQHLISILRKELLDSVVTEKLNTEYRALLISAIRTLARARVTLETSSTNQRLLLENLFLQLPLTP